MTSPEGSIIGPRRPRAIRCTAASARVIASATLFLTLAITTVAEAQTSIPIAGQYPGGHTGLRAAGFPPPGTVSVASFLRFSHAYALKDSDGNTIQNQSGNFFSNIWPIWWTSRIRLLGGNYSVLLAVPFSDAVVQPNDLSKDTSGFGLGDIAILPFLLTYRWRLFDFQWGAGAFAPTGHFDPDKTSRGAGFWDVIGSVGANWYPGGDRRKWSVGAIARLEFNGTQKDTDIDVGNDLVIDWGVGRMIVTSRRSEELIDVGISGFAEWQLTSQTGPSPEDYASRYRVFAIGPEIHWHFPKHKLGLLMRPQWEFGARNTSVSNNFWFNVSKLF